MDEARLDNSGLGRVQNAQQHPKQRESDITHVIQHHTALKLRRTILLGRISQKRP